MKEIVAKLVSEVMKMTLDEAMLKIEVPARDSNGDYSFPCFSLAKEKKKSPLVIAEEIADKFSKHGLTKEVSNVSFSGGYVNFFLDKKLLADSVLKNVKKKDFGKLSLEKKKIGIEYPSPNTNKPLHVGHLRNIAIGEAISKIVKTSGNEVVHLNLFNDRGILISKSMLGYEKYGEGKTPESEGVSGDKFVGDFYVKFSKDSEKDKKLEEEALKKLELWEKGDTETRELWSKLNSWAYSGMQNTFDTFGLSKIDKSYYESEIFEEGKSIVEKGLSEGVFSKKKDGAIFIDLESEKLGEKILVRKDGTSVYITTDLALAEKKINEFSLDSSYHVVGSDQDYHFKVLFSILEKIGMKKDYRHISYGMVSLPSGKMSSREGTSVSAEDLIEDTRKLAEGNIIEKGSVKLPKDELYRRSLVNALAAIKYSLLKVDSKRKIAFDPNKALEFEGDTGTYLLYSYARASSIGRKVKSEKKVEILDLKDEEIRLLKKINSFEEVILDSYERLAPNLIANYSFELATLFNEFYHSCPVLGSAEEGFRLALVDAFRITMKKSLGLLGIETLEEM